MAAPEKSETSSAVAWLGDLRAQGLGIGFRGFKRVLPRDSNIT